MKLKASSLLAPALLVAGAAHAAEIYNRDGNRLDLYGKVDGLHYFSSDKRADGDQSYVRPGFKGETQVNDLLTGYGQWEYNIQASRAGGDGGQSWTRLGFAGLKYGDWGSFDYGRNYGVVYDVTSWTDVLPEFGGDTYGPDNFLQQRASNVATYRNNTFFSLVDGLHLALQAQGRNGAGGSLVYDIGDGFSIGTAIASSKRTDEQNKLAFGNGDKATTYTGGLKYDASNVYLAMQYTRSYNATRFGRNDGGYARGFANKAQNVEATAQYQFDSGLRPSVAWLYSRGRSIEGYGDQDLLNYIDLGTTYFFNRNMSTYIDYKINLIDDNKFTRATGVPTDNVVATGLVYQF